MPVTGHKCPQSGIYRNDCHGEEIALSVGEVFPPCAKCHKAANWPLVRETRSGQAGVPPGHWWNRIWSRSS